MIYILILLNINNSINFEKAITNFEIQSFYKKDSTQVSFENFKILKLPLNIENIKIDKELDLITFANFIQTKKSKIYTKTYNNSNEYEGVNGLSMEWTEAVETYTIDTKTKQETKNIFLPKLYALGKISLKNNINSVIIKNVQTETTTFRLFNFNKNGQLISVIDLYKFFNDYSEKPSDKSLSLIIKSQINEKGELLISFKNNNFIEKKIKGVVNENAEFIKK